MVEAFCIVLNGAWPGSCWPLYESDYPAVTAYLTPGDETLQAHLRQGPEVRAMEAVQ